jgi:hypothetical protein
MKDDYYIGVDLAAPGSQGASTMVISKRTNRIFEIVDMINITPFCPIHNAIEDNKFHSQNIKVCDQCQKQLLKNDTNKI